jgi:lipoyl(octanoyl) transferase
MKQLNKKIILQDLGTVAYKTAWDVQEKLFAKIVEMKIQNRDLEEDKQQITPNYLLLCQHPHVYTLGKSGSMQNLLLSEQQLKDQNIDFYHINRGGDITYHGFGQIVGYPIVDLDNFFQDIHRYMRALEEVIIRTIAEYGLLGGRISGLTGVWLDYEENAPNPRKICALGVKTSRWVTMHGFALNLSTDLNYFNNIIPCGIDDKSVTSLEKELQKGISEEEVKDKILKHFKEIFEVEEIEKSLTL